ncbi:MAG: GNAT family N-acetyltransferase [Acidobacteriaceae bacterium]
MTPPQFHLRCAVASDLDAVLALERATDLAPHWPLAAYAGILESIPPQRGLFVAEKNGQLIGFAVGLLHPATHDPANLKQNCHSDHDPEQPEGEGEKFPHVSVSNRVAELESVVVSANARRAGIGCALCRAVLDWSRSEGASEVVLEVRANSTAAVALYASLGFTQVARRPRYYRGPDDDALLLRLVLP